MAGGIFVGSLAAGRFRRVSLSEGTGLLKKSPECVLYGDWPECYGVTTMKTPLLPLVAVCFTLLASGCTLTEKYNKNNAAGQAWLQANCKSPAKTDFEGVYYSPDWGAVYLNQQNGKITGAIAHYQVKGLASGKSAYLLLVDDEWIEQTMILKKKNSEILDGSYSSHVPYSAKDSLPVHLDKIVY